MSNAASVTQKNYSVFCFLLSLILTRHVRGSRRNLENSCEKIVD